MLTNRPLKSLMPTRREFLASLPAFAIVAQATSLFDLLIKGGRVFDPAQGLSTVLDVAVSNSTIAHIAADISAEDPFVFADSRKETRTGPRGLVPDMTFRAGVRVSA